jgi:hypothetical protein
VTALDPAASSMNRCRIQGQFSKKKFYQDEVLWMESWGGSVNRENAGFQS